MPPKDIKWNKAYEGNLARLSRDPRLTTDDVRRLHGKSTKKEKVSNEFKEGTILILYYAIIYYHILCDNVLYHTIPYYTTMSYTIP